MKFQKKEFTSIEFKTVVLIIFQWIVVNFPTPFLLYKFYDNNNVLDKLQLVKPGISV